MPLRTHHFGPNESTDWRFPSDTSDETDFVKSTSSRHVSEDLTSMMSPRRVSFFDVGGLLDQESPRRLSSARTMNTEYTGESSTQGEGPVSTTWSYENGLSPAPPRRGSTALLQDIGGLLGARTRAHRYSSTGYELKTITQDRTVETPTSHPRQLGSTSNWNPHPQPQHQSEARPIDELGRQQAKI
ncbi:hypothetical protein DID88_007756 [Monilinia fructigena]|uniref:Uncharacterized protein n=1 Tax=Monilinia fructigena TaxID=38457 RepID=A0A395J3X4_9HELO|nr:hypothetical protein DID88_007756 [Monilinia fructigena]